MSWARVRAILLACWLAACGRVSFGELANPDADALTDPDNCPGIDNPSQADEDGDGLGDVCDPCPISPNNADSDGDGVGDDCDPNPAMPGDHLVVFEGFIDEPVGPTRLGNWVVANGQMVVTSAAGMRSELAWPLDGSATRTIRTRIHIDQMFGNLVARSLGLADELDATAPAGIPCVFGIDTSNTQVFALGDIASAGSLSTLGATSGAGVVADLAERRLAAQTSCDSTASAGLHLTTSAAIVGPSIGLHSRATSGRFDWVMIVDSP